MTITVVGNPSGDWEGVYVDGILKFEGHSIQWWQMLKALGIEYTTFDADDEWLLDRGRLPEKLTEVKKETE